jgi:hypothetical protein
MAKWIMSCTSFVFRDRDKRSRPRSRVSGGIIEEDVGVGVRRRRSLFQLDLRRGMFCVSMAQWNCSEMRVCEGDEEEVEVGSVEVDI